MGEDGDKLERSREGERWDLDSVHGSINGVPSGRILRLIDFIRDVYRIHAQDALDEVRS